MKRSKKIWLITAFALIFVGAVISAFSLAAIDFDFKMLSTVNYETNTYTVEDSFESISVEAAECDIRLAVSQNSECSVVCSESDSIYHTVEVSDGTLTVRRTDDRKWYERIGIYWAEMEVVIFLPEKEYNSLYLESLSGVIEIPDNFSFFQADVKTTSGDIEFSASVKNDLTLKSVSGDVSAAGVTAGSAQIKSTSGDAELSNLTVNSEMKLKTVSGNIEIESAECESFTADSTSGDIELEDVVCSGALKAEAVSGNIELLRCDARSLWIKTVSGDVRGLLLSEKIFITDTESGNINVPNSVSGGSCEIKTTSGNIEISLDN